MFSALSLMHLSIVEVCKRGYCEPLKGCISIYYNEKNYRKFRNDFDKKFKEFTKEELKRQMPFVRIEIPYKKLFGESWKNDHIEYWGELTILMFIGKNFNLYYDRNKWLNCSGVEGCGRNFEDMIVDMGKKFKTRFGDFDDDAFLTPPGKS